MKKEKTEGRLIILPLIIVVSIMFMAACTPAAPGANQVVITGQVRPESPNDEGPLPAGSQIIVQVQDTGRADAPAIILGEQIITGDAKLPAAYEVGVDRAAFDKAAQVSVLVRIENADDQLLFINDTMHLVSADETVVDVEVIAVRRGDGGGSLPAAFDGQVWQWIAFEDSADGAESGDITVDKPSQYTLQLYEDGTYGIKIDCNQGSGKYQLEGNSLTLTPGVMTLAACGPDSLSDQYLALLHDVVTFVFDQEGHLVLNLKMDAGNMIFARVINEDKSLADTRWTLENIVIGEGVTSTYVDAEITALFEDGQVSGSAGCNRYFGGYQVEGEKLTFDALGSTRMLCDDARNERETEFLTAMQSVEGYRLEGDRLILLDGEGNPLVEFSAME